MASKKCIVGLSFLAVFYLTSFGPACWWALNRSCSTKREAVGLFYRPVLWAGNHVPKSSRNLLRRYMGLGLPPGIFADFKDRDIYCWDTRATSF